MSDPLRLGVVGRAHGLRGAVRVEDAVDWFGFAVGEAVLLDGRLVRIRERRGEGGGSVLVRLEGVEDRTAAEALRGLPLELERDAAPALEAGEVWSRDLVGCEVVCAGETLGRVREVLPYPANDVLVVDGADGELLLPFTADALPVVDLAARRIELREGLL